MKDNYGDPLTVEVDMREVALFVEDVSGLATWPRGDKRMTFGLSPKKARRLAKQLKRAARQVEQQ